MSQYEAKMREAIAQQHKARAILEASVLSTPADEFERDMYDLLRAALDLLTIAMAKQVYDKPFTSDP